MARMMEFYEGFRRMQMVIDAEPSDPNFEDIVRYAVNGSQLDDGDVHFYSNFGKNDWRAFKKQYGIKVSCGPTASSSSSSEDEDNGWNNLTLAEKEAQLLSDEKREKEKAEKKRLKKQRQKERRRLEKQQNAAHDTKEKEITSQTCNGNKDSFNLKDMALTLESESGDDASDESGDEEELDLQSSFVTKAAEIAKRQLEQKQENKDKKKSPVKEETQTKTPVKSVNEENNVNRNEVKKNNSPNTLPSSPKLEDFIKISSEFAILGNKSAAEGDFNMAVKYFTDAIKYNPTEYRLFGNRAFCFEKLREYDKSLSDADLSLSMNPGWVKGLFRKGRALAGLKRYGEAAAAFKQVLEQNSAGTEAAQDLMHVQIMQLMEYGFTREQSSKALVIYGSVEKAVEELLKNSKPVPPPSPVPVLHVANVNGVSPVLSAKAAKALPPLSVPAMKTETKPFNPVQNQQIKTEPIVAPKPSPVGQPPELFPIWVGNLSLSVPEYLLSDLFNRVGTVYSLKHLPSKRCAFINFTKQEDCDEAIRRYHGYDLKGSRLSVRYPDRIPPGLNISKAAHKANDYDENIRYNHYVAGGNGRPYHNYRDPYYKY